MSISPPIAFALAARSGKRTAYEAIRMSRVFFKVSCILHDTKSAAKQTSYAIFSELGEANKIEGRAW